MSDRIEPRPILIVGVPRSGTSMVGGIINICGAWGGDMRGPNPANEKGMFENKVIVGEIIKPMLSKWGCDPLGQDPLPNIGFVKSITNPKSAARLRRQILEALQKQGLQEGQQWFYKGLKMTLAWPLFAAAFPEAQWVMVRRDAEDIVNSCLRTRFMRAYNTRSGWLGWVAHHEKCLEQMVDAGLDTHEIWPQRMVAGDFKGMQALINKLGLTWKEKEVVNFVDPGLWRRWQARKEKRMHG